MSQFSATQSINGLQVFTLFTVPLDGDYFIQGNLQLPLPTGSGQSAVVAVIKKDSTTVYTGAAGATGFALPSLALTAAQVITVTLTSSADVDQPLNAVTGVVAVGTAV